MYDLLEPEIDKMKKSGIVITKELMPTQLCDEIIDVYENIVKTQPSHVLRSDVGQNWKELYHEMIDLYV